MLATAPTRKSNSLICLYLLVVIALVFVPSPLLQLSRRRDARYLELCSTTINIREVMLLLLNSTLLHCFDRMVKWTDVNRNADSPIRMWFLIASTYCGRTNLIDIVFEERLTVADHQDQALFPVLLAGNSDQNRTLQGKPGHAIVHVHKLRNFRSLKNVVLRAYVPVPTGCQL